MGKRERSIPTETFIVWRRAGFIRPASFDDVLGTHHKRALYRHPNTRDYYVAVAGTPADKPRAG